MIELTSKQRKNLRAQAHHLKPLIQIGKAGVSDHLVRETDSALSHHELIKVKFGEFKEERNKLSELLAEKCQAQIAGILGNICILYREKPAAETKAELH